MFNIKLNINKSSFLKATQENVFIVNLSTVLCILRVNLILSI